MYNNLLLYVECNKQAFFSFNWIEGVRIISINDKYQEVLSFFYFWCCIYMYCNYFRCIKIEGEKKQEIEND